MKRKWTAGEGSQRWVILWIVLVLLSGIPLFGLYLNYEPTSIDTSEGSATFYFEADRSQVLFPGQCVTLNWAVEGIKEVYINGRGFVGHASTVSCNTDTRPNMRVVLQDETERSFNLPVARLYSDPIIVLLWIGFIAALTALVYMLAGISGAVFILTIVLFWAITRISIETGSDYRIHLRYQQIVLDTGDLNALPPHPLYYFLGVLVASLFPGIPLTGANFIVIIMAYGAASVATFWLLRVTIGEFTVSKHWQAVIYIPLTLSLWCVVPLVVSGNPLNTLIGRADIPMNMFNSPTLLVLRPFAVFAFLGLVKWLINIPARRWIPVLAVGTAIIAGTLAKPNYTMAFAPASVLLLGWSFVRPLRLNRALLLAGVVLPALVVLGWQYLRVYAADAPSTSYNPDQSTGIGIAPFQLYLTHWGFTSWELLRGLILSALFPLTVYVTHFRVASRDLLMNLAWVVFLIGQSFGYVFIEIGYEAAGNMTWGGRITLLVLFVYSLGFLIRQNAGSLLDAGRLPRDPRFYLCSTVYVLHLLSYLQYASVRLA